MAGAEPSRLGVGCEVRVPTGDERLRAMRCGWDDGMEKVLGRVGVVEATHPECVHINFGQVTYAFDYDIFPEDLERMCCRGCTLAPTHTPNGRAVCDSCLVQMPKGADVHACAQHGITYCSYCCGRPVALAYGARVLRGPTWNWGDQDGGATRQGTVVDVDGANYVEVEWDMGGSNKYRHVPLQDVIPLCKGGVECNMKLEETRARRRAERATRDVQDMQRRQTDGVRSLPRKVFNPARGWHFTDFLPSVLVSDGLKVATCVRSAECTAVSREVVVPTPHDTWRVTACSVTIVDTQDTPLFVGICGEAPISLPQYTLGSPMFPGSIGLMLKPAPDGSSHAAGGACDTTRTTAVLLDAGRVVQEVPCAGVVKGDVAAVAVDAAAARVTFFVNGMVVATTQCIAAPYRFAVSLPRQGQSVSLTADTPAAQLSRAPSPVHGTAVRLLPQQPPRALDALLRLPRKPYVAARGFTFARVDGIAVGEGMQTVSRAEGHDEPCTVVTREVVDLSRDIHSDALAFHVRVDSLDAATAGLSVGVTAERPTGYNTQPLGMLPDSVALVCRKDTMMYVTAEGDGGVTTTECKGARGLKAGDVISCVVCTKGVLRFLRNGAVLNGSPGTVGERLRFGVSLTGGTAVGLVPGTAAPPSPQDEKLDARGSSPQEAAGPSPSSLLDDLLRLAEYSPEHPASPNPTHAVSSLRMLLGGRRGPDGADDNASDVDVESHEPAGPHSPEGAGMTPASGVDDDTDDDAQYYRDTLLRDPELMSLLSLRPGLLSSLRDGGRGRGDEASGSAEGSPMDASGRSDGSPLPPDPALQALLAAVAEVPGEEMDESECLSTSSPASFSSDDEGVEGLQCSGARPQLEVVAATAADGAFPPRADHSHHDSALQALLTAVTESHVPGAGGAAENASSSSSSAGDAPPPDTHDLSSNGSDTAPAAPDVKRTVSQDPALQALLAAMGTTASVGMVPPPPAGREPLDVHASNFATTKPKPEADACSESSSSAGGEAPPVYNDIDNADEDDSRPPSDAEGSPKHDPALQALLAAVAAIPPRPAAAPSTAELPAALAAPTPTASLGSGSAGGAPPSDAAKDPALHALLGAITEAIPHAIPDFQGETGTTTAPSAAAADNERARALLAAAVPLNTNADPPGDESDDEDDAYFRRHLLHAGDAPEGLAAYLTSHPQLLALMQAPEVLGKQGKAEQPAAPAENDAAETRASLSPSSSSPSESPRCSLPKPPFRRYLTSDEQVTNSADAAAAQDEQAAPPGTTGDAVDDSAAWRFTEAVEWQGEIVHFQPLAPHRLPVGRASNASATTTSNETSASLSPLFAPKFRTRGQDQQQQHELLSSFRFGDGTAAAYAPPTPNNASSSTVHRASDSTSEPPPPNAPRLVPTFSRQQRVPSDSQSSVSTSPLPSRVLQPAPSGRTSVMSDSCVPLAPPAQPTRRPDAARTPRSGFGARRGIRALAPSSLFTDAIEAVSPVHEGLSRHGSIPDACTIFGAACELQQVSTSSLGALPVAATTVRPCPDSPQTSVVTCSPYFGPGSPPRRGWSTRRTASMLQSLTAPVEAEGDAWWDVPVAAGGVTPRRGLGWRTRSAASSISLAMLPPPAPGASSTTPRFGPRRSSILLPGPAMSTVSPATPPPLPLVQVDSIARDFMVNIGDDVEVQSTLHSSPSAMVASQLLQPASESPGVAEQSVSPEGASDVPEEQGQLLRPLLTVTVPDDDGPQSPPRRVRRASRPSSMSASPTSERYPRAFSVLSDVTPSDSSPRRRSQQRALSVSSVQTAEGGRPCVALYPPAVQIFNIRTSTSLAPPRGLVRPFIVGLDVYAALGGVEQLPELGLSAAQLPTELGGANAGKGVEVVDAGACEDVLSSPPLSNTPCGAPMLRAHSHAPSSCSTLPFVCTGEVPPPVVLPGGLHVPLPLLSPASEAPSDLPRIKSAVSLCADTDLSPSDRNATSVPTALRPRPAGSANGTTPISACRVSTDTTIPSPLSSTAVDPTGTPPPLPKRRPMDVEVSSPALLVSAGLRSRTSMQPLGAAALPPAPRRLYDVGSGIAATASSASLGLAASPQLSASPPGAPPAAPVLRGQSNISSLSPLLSPNEDTVSPMVGTVFVDDDGGSRRASNASTCLTLYTREQVGYEPRQATPMATPQRRVSFAAEDAEAETEEDLHRLIALMPSASMPHDPRITQDDTRRAILSPGSYLSPPAGAGGSSSLVSQTAAVNAHVSLLLLPDPQGDVVSDQASPLLTPGSAGYLTLPAWPVVLGTQNGTGPPQASAPHDGEDRAVVPLTGRTVSRFGGGPQVDIPPPIETLPDDNDDDDGSDGGSSAVTSPARVCEERAALVPRALVQLGSPVDEDSSSPTFNETYPSIPSMVSPLYHWRDTDAPASSAEGPAGDGGSSGAHDAAALTLENTFTSIPSMVSPLYHWRDAPAPGSGPADAAVAALDSTASALPSLMSPLGLCPLPHARSSEAVDAWDAGTSPTRHVATIAAVGELIGRCMQTNVGWARTPDAAEADADHRAGNPTAAETPAQGEGGPPPAENPVTPFWMPPSVDVPNDDAADDDDELRTLSIPPVLPQHSETDTLMSVARGVSLLVLPQRAPASSNLRPTDTTPRMHPWLPTPPTDWLRPTPPDASLSQLPRAGDGATPVLLFATPILAPAVAMGRPHRTPAPGPHDQHSPLSASHTNMSAFGLPGAPTLACMSTTPRRLSGAVPPDAPQAVPLGTRGRAGSEIISECSGFSPSPLFLAPRAPAGPRDLLGVPATLTYSAELQPAIGPQVIPSGIPGGGAGGDGNGGMEMSPLSLHRRLPHPLQPMREEPQEAATPPPGPTESEAHEQPVSAPTSASASRAKRLARWRRRRRKVRGGLGVGATGQPRTTVQKAFVESLGRALRATAEVAADGDTRGGFPQSIRIGAVLRAPTVSARLRDGAGPAVPVYKAIADLCGRFGVVEQMSTDGVLLTFSSDAAHYFEYAAFPAEVERRCPHNGGQCGLQEFVAATCSFSCDACGVVLPKGARLRGCRAHDFDLCIYCAGGGRETFERGDAVVRGPTWRWGIQDGAPPTWGVVVDPPDRFGWLGVAWIGGPPKMIPHTAAEVQTIATATADADADTATPETGAHLAPASPRVRAVLATRAARDPGVTVWRYRAAPYADVMPLHGGYTVVDAPADGSVGVGGAGTGTAGMAYPLVPAARLSEAMGEATLSSCSLDRALERSQERVVPAVGLAEAGGEATLSSCSLDGVLERSCERAVFPAERCVETAGTEAALSSCSLDRALDLAHERVVPRVHLAEAGGEATLSSCSLDRVLDRSHDRSWAELPLADDEDEGAGGCLKVGCEIRAPPYSVKLRAMKCNFNSAMCKTAGRVAVVRGVKRDFVCLDFGLTSFIFDYDIFPRDVRRACFDGGCRLTEGTVAASGSYCSSCYVHFPVGAPYRGCRDHDFDLCLYCCGRPPVLAEGCAVVRGPTWRAGNEDGGVFTPGVVVRIESGASYDVVHVVWGGSGVTKQYRGAPFADVMPRYEGGSPCERVESLRRARLGDDAGQEEANDPALELPLPQTDSPLRGQGAPDDDCGCDADSDASDAADHRFVKLLPRDMCEVSVDRRRVKCTGTAPCTVVMEGVNPVGGTPAVDEDEYVPPRVCHIRVVRLGGGDGAGVSVGVTPETPSGFSSHRLGDAAFLNSLCLHTGASSPVILHGGKRVQVDTRGLEALAVGDILSVSVRTRAVIGFAINGQTVNQQFSVKFPSRFAVSLHAVGDEVEIVPPGYFLPRSIGGPWHRMYSRDSRFPLPQLPTNHDGTAVAGADAGPGASAPLIPGARVRLDLPDEVVEGEFMLGGVGTIHRGSSDSKDDTEHSVPPSQTTHVDPSAAPPPPARDNADPDAPAAPPLVSYSPFHTTHPPDRLKPPPRGDATSSPFFATAAATRAAVLSSPFFAGAACGPAAAHPVGAASMSSGSPAAKAPVATSRATDVVPPGEAALRACAQRVGRLVAVTASQVVVAFAPEGPDQAVTVAAVGYAYFPPSYERRCWRDGCGGKLLRGRVAHSGAACDGCGVLLPVGSPRVRCAADGYTLCLYCCGVRTTLREGVRVVRGPTWRWGDQDGGRLYEGTVQDMCRGGWVRVRWDAGGVNLYRVGQCQDVIPAYDGNGGDSDHRPLASMVDTAALRLRGRPVDGRVDATGVVSPAFVLARSVPRTLHQRARGFRFVDFQGAGAVAGEFACAALLSSTNPPSRGGTVQRQQRDRPSALHTVVHLTQGAVLDPQWLGDAVCESGAPAAASFAATARRCCLTSRDRRRVVFFPFDGAAGPQARAFTAVTEDVLDVEDGEEVACSFRIDCLPAGGGAGEIAFGMTNDLPTGFHERHLGDPEFPCTLCLHSHPESGLTLRSGELTIRVLHIPPLSEGDVITLCVGVHGGITVLVNGTPVSTQFSAKQTFRFACSSNLPGAAVILDTPTTP